MEQYILRFYCAVVIALSTCTTTFAQFYDNDDEIHFYQCTLLNGKVNEASTRNNSWVFNFDGMKATDFGSHSTLGIKNVLKENLNYFEGQVVCGDAGSGKSAICKKVLMEEEMVIFARAEKIASCDSY